MPVLKPPPELISRRQLLRDATMGMGTLGLGVLLADAASAFDPADPLAPKAPPLPAKAKRVIHIFMNGGPSQVDTWDPKPALTKYSGGALPIHLRTERPTGAAFPSPFEFRRHGQSGIEVSEIFPKVAEHVDDLCVIRSMYTDVPNHGPSLMMMNTGTTQQSRPSFGSWLTYGLGTENRNLPGFIVLCPGGYPVWGAKNWRSAFLPGAYQATHVDTKHGEPDKLIENVRSRFSGQDAQRQQLDLLGELNQAHREQRGEDPLLEARVQSFELAYRMQAEATDAFDLSAEPRNIRDSGYPLYSSCPDGGTIALIYQLLVGRQMPIGCLGAVCFTANLWLKRQNHPESPAKSTGTNAGSRPDMSVRITRVKWITRIRDLYGETLHGRQMLIARRLLEKGVRFVQVWHGAGQPWDSHSEIESNHRRLAGECDQPIAALLIDLNQRGMLDDTLVIWGGEFGRTPVVELSTFGANAGKNGRDHNSWGFSMWLAGGGVRPGYVHGATDDFGFRAEQDKVHVHDLHATLLHLLGFDHEHFTYRYAGRDFRLTDVHGRVVRELIA